MNKYNFGGFVETSKYAYGGMVSTNPNQKKGKKGIPTYTHGGYHAMEDYGGYTQPSQFELQKYGFNTFDDFRSHYNQVGESMWDPADGAYPGYDWKGIDKWGAQHGQAWESYKETGAFVPGSYMNPDQGVGGQETFNFPGGQVWDPRSSQYSEAEGGPMYKDYFTTDQNDWTINTGFQNSSVQETPQSPWEKAIRSKFAVDADVSSYLDIDFQSHNPKNLQDLDALATSVYQNPHDPGKWKKWDSKEEHYAGLNWWQKMKYDKGEKNAENQALKTEYDQYASGQDDPMSFKDWKFANLPFSEQIDGQSMIVGPEGDQDKVWFDEQGNVSKREPYGRGKGGPDGEEGSWQDKYGLNWDSVKKGAGNLLIAGATVAPSIYALGQLNKLEKEGLAELEDDRWDDIETPTIESKPAIAHFEKQIKDAREMTLAKIKALKDKGASTGAIENAMAEGQSAIDKMQNERRDVITKDRTETTKLRAVTELEVDKANQLKDIKNSLERLQLLTATRAGRIKALQTLSNSILGYTLTMRQVQSDENTKALAIKIMGSGDPEMQNYWRSSPYYDPKHEAFLMNE